MDLKSIPAEPFTQNVQQSLARQVVLKGNHRIIGISDQQTSTFEPRSHHTLEPFVQHMVQVNVREQWRDGSANAKDNFCFERMIVEWRERRSLVDLRRKK